METSLHASYPVVSELETMIQNSVLCISLTQFFIRVMSIHLNWQLLRHFYLQLLFFPYNGGQVVCFGLLKLRFSGLLHVLFRGSFHLRFVRRFSITTILDPSFQSSNRGNKVFQTLSVASRPLLVGIFSISAFLFPSISSDPSLSRCAVSAVPMFVGANLLLDLIFAPYFMNKTGMGTRARATHPRRVPAQLTPNEANYMILVTY